MEMNWKNIKISENIRIEKCVGEFDIWDVFNTPYGKYKIKIYERQNGKYIGYTNLQLKDEDGCPFSGVGHGDSLEKALMDTIQYFSRMIQERDNVNEEDFVYADPNEF